LEDESVEGGLVGPGLVPPAAPNAARGSHFFLLTGPAEERSGSREDGEESGGLEVVGARGGEKGRVFEEEA